MKQAAIHRNGRGRRLRRSGRRGSAMLEFALIFTVMIFLTLGLFELGRAAWAYNTIAYTARQASRYAGLHGEYQPATDADVLQVAQASAIGLDGNRLTTSTTYTPDRAYGSMVQVVVDYPLPYILSPLILKNSTLNLRATATAVVTQ